LVSLWSFEIVFIKEERIKFKSVFTNQNPRALLGAFFLSVVGLIAAIILGIMPLIIAFICLAGCFLFFWLMDFISRTL
jgi:hypothetical protein